MREEVGVRVKVVVGDVVMVPVGVTDPVCVTVSVGVTVGVDVMVVVAVCVGVGPVGVSVGVLEGVRVAAWSGAPITKIGSVVALSMTAA